MNAAYIQTFASKIILCATLNQKSKEDGRSERLLVERRGNGWWGGGGFRKEGPIENSPWRAHTSTWLCCFISGLFSSQPTGFVHEDTDFAAEFSFLQIENCWHFELVFEEYSCFLKVLLYRCFNLRKIKRLFSFEATKLTPLVLHFSHLILHWLALSSQAGFSQASLPFRIPISAA